MPDGLSFRAHKLKNTEFGCKEGPYGLALVLGSRDLFRLTTLKEVV